MSLENQERSLFLIKAEALAAWVTSNRSGALIVNGNTPVATRSSPLSFVCARFVYELDQLPAAAKSNIVTLSFFCGQHVPSGETQNSPSGIVNSFIAQLLTQCKKLDVRDILADLPPDFDNEDISHVLSVLAKLVKLFPPRVTIFCVIDALSYYVDDNDTAEDAKELVRKLTRLASRQTKRQPLFKLMITAPTRLRLNESIPVHGAESLTLPSHVPNTGGFTARRWDFGIGKEISELGVVDN